jgi:hypothetical protein
MIKQPYYCRESPQIIQIIHFEKILPSDPVRSRNSGHPKTNMRQKLEKRSVNALKLLHAFSTDISPPIPMTSGSLSSNGFGIIVIQFGAEISSGTRKTKKKWRENKIKVLLRWPLARS